VALLAEDVPEHHGVEVVVIRVQADFFRPLHQEILALAAHGNAGQIALDVGTENRHASFREPFGEDLQRDRLAGAGRAGDQAVAIGKLEVEILALLDRVLRVAAAPQKNPTCFLHPPFLAH